MDIEQAIQLLKMHKLKAMVDADNVEEFDIAIEALERRKAKKTINVTSKSIFGRCPTCNNRISPYMTDCCSDCGQELLWNKEM